jgi:hypothetical protein
VNAVIDVNAAIIVYLALGLALVGGQLMDKDITYSDISLWKILLRTAIIMVVVVPLSFLALPALSKLLQYLNFP